MAIAAAPQVIRAAAQAAPGILNAVKTGGGDAYRKLEQWFNKSSGTSLAKAVSGPVSQDHAMAMLEGAVRFAPNATRRIGNAVFDANPALTDREWEAYVAQIRSLHEAGNVELRRQAETHLDGNQLALARHKELQVANAVNDINNGNMTIDGLLNLARLMHDFDDNMAEVLTANNPSLATTTPVVSRSR